MKRSVVNVRQSPKGWIEYDIVVVWPNGEEEEERRQCPRQSMKAAKEWAQLRWNHIFDLGPPSTREERAPAPLFDAFAERCLTEHDEAERHKASTIKTKRVRLRAHLLPLFRYRPMDSFNEKDVSAIKSRMVAMGLSKKTTNNVLSDFAVILECAAKWKIIHRDRVPEVAMLALTKKRMPFYSAEHYEKQLAGAFLLSDTRVAAVIALAGDGGMRKGEILALDWSRVDMDGGTIVAELNEVDRVVGTTKSDAWRWIVMTDTMKDALERMPKRKGRVIYGRAKSGGVDQKTLGDFVRRAESRAGIEVTGRLHVLRHTYASHQAQDDQSLYKIQTAMGHSDIKTTEGYAKLNTKALRALADAINVRRSSRPPAQVGEEWETNKTMRSQGRKKPRKTKKKVVEAVGIEPTTPLNSQPSDVAQESAISSELAKR